ncbi:MAG: hypothetical protein RR263_00685, partial [Oscillospiraceae bacterium]
IMSSGSLACFANEVQTKPATTIEGQSTTESGQANTDSQSPTQGENLQLQELPSETQGKESSEVPSQEQEAEGTRQDVLTEQPGETGQVADTTQEPTEVAPVAAQTKAAEPMVAAPTLDVEIIAESADKAGFFKKNSTGNLYFVIKDTNNFYNSIPAGNFVATGTSGDYNDCLGFGGVEVALTGIDLNSTVLTHLTPIFAQAVKEKIKGGFEANAQYSGGAFAFKSDGAGTNLTLYKLDGTDLNNISGKVVQLPFAVKAEFQGEQEITFDIDPSTTFNLTYGQAAGESGDVKYSKAAPVTIKVDTQDPRVSEVNTTDDTVTITDKWLASVTVATDGGAAVEQTGIPTDGSDFKLTLPVGKQSRKQHNKSQHYNSRQQRRFKGKD